MRRKLSATFAACLSLSAATSTQAHIHDDPHDPVSEELMKHRDWIMSATTKNGYDCCHDKDVLAGLPEDIIGGHYVVTVPKGMKIFLNPDNENQFFIVQKDLKITISSDRVLDPETANQVCAKKKTATCTPPRNLNVLFADPYSLKNGDSFAYCYLPLPQAAKLKGVKRRAFASFMAPHQAQAMPGLAMN